MRIVPLLVSGGLVLAGCSEERPVRSVQEFVDNPQFLEAAVVRCAANRVDTRYDAECINARKAVSQIAAQEERERRAVLEAESQRKRDALRRTQQAAAAARLEAAERARLREEAEYHAQFGAAPPPVDPSTQPDLTANTPGAIIPAAPTENAATGAANTVMDTDEPEVIFDPVAPRDSAATSPATDGGNAPTKLDGSNAPTASTETDLNSIRDELRRRQDGSGS